MIGEIHFHFNEHPVIGFILMLSFITASVLLNFAEEARDLVPFAQILACAMTVLVGYKTLRKQNKK